MWNTLTRAWQHGYHTTYYCLKCIKNVREKLDRPNIWSFQGKHVFSFNFTYTFRPAFLCQLSSPCSMAFFPILCQCHRYSFNLQKNNHQTTWKFQGSLWIVLVLRNLTVKGQDLWSYDPGSISSTSYQFWLDTGKSFILTCSARIRTINTGLLCAWTQHKFPLCLFEKSLAGNGWQEYILSTPHKPQYDLVN